MSRPAPGTVERILADCEREPRPDLVRLGFWRAVGVTKRDPALVARYADRIGRIDRAAFERGVLLRVPIALGVAADLVGLGISIALVAGSASFGAPWRELAFLAGGAGLLVVTHTLAHWVVGTLAGIRFTHAFSAPPKRPQPGFKIDYASYLRAPAAARAWMHASGALVTKLVPFALVPFAVGERLDAWAVATLVVIGILQIATDAIWSVRASDWKKFRRELRAARG